MSVLGSKSVAPMENGDCWNQLELAPIKKVRTEEIQDIMDVGKE